MEDKIRKYSINIAVLIVAAFFTLLSAEMLIRPFTPTPALDGTQRQDGKYYQHDPLLGWVKRPNLDTIRSTAGKLPVIYKTNSKGIRGPEYEYKKTDNEYRILILGDSFADGYMVKFSEMFSEVMKNKLNNIVADKKVESINAGTIGWSTDQELIFFQNEGRKYNPDLTVLMFYENDVAYVNQTKDWSMNYKPMFKVKGEKLFLTNVPVPEPDIFVIHEPLEKSEQSVFKRFRRWLNVNSYLYKFLKKRLDNGFLLKGRKRTNKDADKLSGEQGFFPIEFRVWEKNYNESVHEAWEKVEKLITELQKEVALSESELLIFYIPFESSVYEEEWKKIKRVYDLNDEEWDPGQAGIVLEGICLRNNINFINPIELFRKKAKELERNKTRLYDSIDHHWTVEGNKLVSEILVEYILTKYFSEEAAFKNHDRVSD